MFARWTMLLLPLTAATLSEHQSAKQKFDQIESDRLPPGSRVTLTAGELNAWVRGELKTAAPAGVRDPKVELGNGTATAFAYIDFVRVRQAQGKPPSWLLAKMLGGEHPVRVSTRIRSGGGMATVDVTRVEISGVPIEGRALDFLIQKYLIPNFPDAKVGTPFALRHRVDRFEVQPQAAVVVIGR